MTFSYTIILLRYIFLGFVLVQHTLYATYNILCTTYFVHKNFLSNNKYIVYEKVLIQYFLYVMLVTQTRKYGCKHRDALVVVHINLTGFPCNSVTFNTRHATVYISVNLAMEFSISCGNIVFTSMNYISVYFGWLWPIQTSSGQFGLVQCT